MKDVQRYLDDSQTTLYWSLRIGKFVDQNTGQDLRDSLGVASFSFRGTFKDWCTNLLETGLDVLYKLTNEHYREGKKDTFLASPAVYKNISMIEKRIEHVQINIDENLPYDVMLVISEEGKSGIIKVLDISESGSIK